MSELVSTATKLALRPAQFPRAFSWFALLTLVMHSGVAGATEPRQLQCSQAARDWVRLHLSELDMPAEPLLRRLRGALAAVELDVCLHGSGVPTATVELVGVAGTPRVRVVIHDAVTAKKLERQVDLAEIPADGHPLTLVVVADELLHASWAELSLPAAAVPARTVPAGVTKSMDRALGIAGPRIVGVGLAYEWYAGGQRHSGADVRGALRLNPWLLLTARLGARWATPVEAPLGRVFGTAQLLGAGAAWAVTPGARRAGLELHLRVDVLRLQLSGQSGQEAIGASDTRFSARATAGPLAYVQISRSLRFELEGGFGYVVLPVRAYYGPSLAEGRVATALSGLTLAGNAAVTGSF